MELKSFFPFAAATLMALAACTGDDNVARTDGLPEGAVPLRINAGVTPHVATRAIGTAWNKDHIGVIAVVPDGVTMAPHQRYRNMHYATAAEGSTTAEFTAVDADNTIYFTDGETELMVCAYAPYQPTASPNELPGTDGKIYIDTRKQSTVEEQEAIDFIFGPLVSIHKDAPIASFTKKSDGNDNSFRHSIMCLVLKIQLDEQAGFTASDLDKITKVQIGRLCTGGWFYAMGGTAVTDKQTLTDDWDITGCRHETVTTGGVTQRVYTLILIPQLPDKDAIPLSITLGGEEYKNDGDIKIDPSCEGKSFEYTIVVTRTGLTVTASSDDVPWTPGEAPTITLEGKSFRLIQTAEDLARFAADVNAGQRDLNALQTADIDLQDLKNSDNAEYRKLAEDWVPINRGDKVSYSPFTGIYNGNGYAITGMHINNVREEAYAGLFGKIGDGALLTGIRLEGAEIITEYTPRVGTLVGWVDTDATVSLCSATGKIEATVSGLNTGGLVGVNYGSISCCRTSVQITADATLIGQDCASAGGITGVNTYGSLIFGCRATGDVKVTAKLEGMLGGNYISAGGISGYNLGAISSLAPIYCCSAEGNVSAISETVGLPVYAGGLVGNNLRGTLAHSYARGTATASNNVPGNTAEVMAGAIIGSYDEYRGSVSYCYGAGTVGQGTSNLDAAPGSIGYGTNPDAGAIFGIIAPAGVALTNIPFTVYNPAVTPAYGIIVNKALMMMEVNFFWKPDNSTWPVFNPYFGY